MGRSLKVTTIVPDHKGVTGGSFLVVGPDDEVPAWAEKLIDEAHFEDVDGVDSREAGTAPKRGGPGSGREEWLSFARENGVDAGDDESRESLIAKCEAAGLVEPVE